MMVSCKICDRIRTKKRVIGDRKICSECMRKLKENNYELITNCEALPPEDTYQL